MFNRKNVFFVLLLLAIFGVLVTRPTPVRASADMDRKFALDSVGFLRSFDNVDGLFTDYVASAYRDYFSKQSRFVLIDLAKGSDVLEHAKLPYSKLIMDPEILGQLARTARAQTILRTKVVKEGRNYRFTLDWLHSPQMETIATDSFNLGEPEDGKGFGLDQIRAAIGASLDKMIGKVPFLASITGRDNNSITVNVGANANLAAGDTLVISTLDEVKKHPLLKEIVDWRLAPVGKVVVDQVEEGIAFCHVSEEEPGRQIGRYQKVSQIFKNNKIEKPLVINEAKELDKLAADAPPPTLGYASGTIAMGGLSQSYGNGTTAQLDGGFAFGAKGEGQMWFTREWFGELAGGFGTATFNDALLFSFKIAAGYAFLSPADLFGPKAWIKLGYHSNMYHMPLTTTNAASLTAHSPFLGIGGEMPIRDKWGAILNLEYGVLSGASDNSGQAINGASDVLFYVGGYYKLNPRLILRAGVEFVGDGANYVNGASLSEKMITLSPSLLFYF